MGSKIHVILLSPYMIMVTKITKIMDAQKFFNGRECI